MNSIMGKSKLWDIKLRKSDTLYVVKLSNADETFYKLGITHLDQNGKPRRYNDYRKLGFEI